MLLAVPGGTVQDRAVRWVRPLLLGGVLLLLGGCQNPCQDVCVQMAAVYEECGIPHSSEDLDSCQATYRTATSAEQAQCEAQDLETLRQNLTLKGGGESPCVALEPYQP